MKRPPVGIFRAFVKAANRALHLDKVDVAIASQIEELHATGQSAGWLGLHQFRRTKATDRSRAPILEHLIVCAKIAFVIPGVGLLREDSERALAIQVHPLIASAVQADGQVCQALRVKLPDLLPGQFFWAGNLAVLELKWR